MNLNEKIWDKDNMANNIRHPFKKADRDLFHQIQSITSEEHFPKSNSLPIRNILMNLRNMNL